jgi:hypothetical protein
MAGLGLVTQRCHWPELAGRVAECRVPGGQSCRSNREFNTSNCEVAAKVEADPLVDGRDRPLSGNPLAVAEHRDATIPADSSCAGAP